MSQSCFTSVDVCAIRVSKLTATGHATAGASNGYVSDAEVKVDIGLEIDTGAEFIQKNGCGQILAIVKEPDKIKRSTVSVDLGKFDFELTQLMAGGTLFSSASKGVGYQIPKLADSAPLPVSFECWSKAWDGAQQAVPTFTSPNAAYLHFVIPMVTFVQQPFSLENKINLVTLKGDGNENTSISADGPFNDWPAAIAGPGGITSAYGVYLDNALPTATCGFISVPTAS